MPSVALPFILIVVPTRDLVIQVYSDMADLASRTWIVLAALYDGTSRKNQASMLRRGCDVLVATPCCLIDMLGGFFIDGVKTLLLDNLSYMVWDEADELLSLGFADQMSRILEKALFTPDLHHWFFSTQYQEEQIAKAKSITNGEYIDLSYDISEEKMAIQCSTVKQIFIEVGNELSERFDALEDILDNNPHKSSIVLYETDIIVEEIHERIVNFDGPFCSTHAGYSQARREVAMIMFKNRTIPFLICTMGTSVRELNMQNADIMIFWSMPKTLAQYKWWIGRLGNHAKAFILHTEDDHPRHDVGFSKFLDKNDAVSSLDVDGNKVA